MNRFHLDLILAFAKEPQQKQEFDRWVQQEEVISFLEHEVQDEEIIIYAALPHVFIHAVLMPDINLDDHVIEDIMEWGHNPYSTWTLVISSSDVRVEGSLVGCGSKTLSKGEQILFARSFEGDESRKRYYELEQKISHVLDIHYLPERNAWCKLDQFGDIEDVIKITLLRDLPGNDLGTIITAKKEMLGKYAGVEGFSLCRMFDFTRYKKGSFSGWDNQKERQVFGNGSDIFGRLVVAEGYASYSRGFQLSRIGMPKEAIINRLWGGHTLDEEKQYATFIAHDWKNNRIEEISCAPSALANYFTESNLPFETTPAFFRPEVLQKYKSDRKKYQLGDRSVSCRGAWHLKTFDINAAGQVHTYLVYLSHLPYNEQLHWKQYNEAPKASLSERAITTDFKGQFYEEYDPLPSLKHKLEELNRNKVGWWTLRDEDAPKKVHYPYTTSYDEWAEEILNLDQLVIEGLEEKWLRRKATELGRNPTPQLRALKLTQECLIALGFEEDHAHQLMSPFHEVHNLRSKLKSHASGTEAETIRKQTLQAFGSFRKHFEHICTECDENLQMIIDAFAQFQ